MEEDLWETFPFLKRRTNLTFNEIAELIYQPDLRSVQLLDLKLCEKIVVFNV